jgi:hypothetical protein
MAHRLAKLLDLGDAQTPGLLLPGQLPSALAWMRLDTVQTRRMPEDALQRRDRAPRHAWAARRHTAPALAPRLGGLPGHDVRLHAFDVGDLEAVNQGLPQEWLDVCLNPALVHRERRGFDGPVPAPENTTGFGFLKILMDMDLAKVGVGGSNPLARSRFIKG